ncbi:MAG: RluA family pseudouridine synthase [Bacilli bacterium]|nr:RluA family pseudouridine synthase [Bacilli bacterium]
MALQKQIFTLVVDAIAEPKRLDAYVASKQEKVSRSQLSDENTRLFLNGKPVKKSRLVKEGDRIEVHYQEEFFEGIVAQDIPLHVLYEDREMLVINKEQGMVVHPAAGNHEHTLVNALLFRYGQDFSPAFEDDEEGEVDNAELSVRPGIVHRLDKDTSGVLVIARNRQSHKSLSQQFKDRTTHKVYIALAKGVFKEKTGSIRTNLKRDGNDRKKFTTCSNDEGRDARTDYTVLRQYRDFALVRIELFTGRTHQIRVHFKSIGHTLLGDPLYGKPEGFTLMLHALVLEVTNPSSGRRIRCIAPMPERFRTVLKTTPRPASVRVRSGSFPTATGRD